MPKKNSQNTDIENKEEMTNKSDQSFDDALATIYKQFGNNAIMKIGVDANNTAINSEVLPTSIFQIDKATKCGGFPRGRIIEIKGPESCIADNSFLQYEIWDNNKLINKNGGTISHLYARFNNDKTSKECSTKQNNDNVTFYVKSVGDDGRIMRNEVLDVVKTGKKVCYRVETKSGNILYTTAEHKYMTPKGFVPLSELQEGDNIFIHNRTQNKGKEQYSIKPTVYVKYHPMLSTKIVKDKYIGQKSRLAYEAFLNNMTYQAYIDFLNKEDKKKIDKLQFLSNNIHIHHKDEDFTNNEISNLALVTPAKHGRIHMQDRYVNLSFIAVLSTITSIVEVGEMDTYDLKCMYPYNNYIAEGIVVHNSGKTTICLYFIAECQKKGLKIAYIDAEHALDIKHMSNCGIKEMYVCQPNSAEDGFNIIEALIDGGTDVIVVDSVAAMVPQAEIDGEIGDSHVAIQARIMSQALRKLTGKVSKQGTVLIFINQLRCIDKNTVCLLDNKISTIAHARKGMNIVNNQIMETHHSFDIEGVTLFPVYKTPFQISINHKQPIISEGQYKTVTANEIKTGDYLIQPILPENIIDDKPEYENIFNNNYKLTSFPNVLNETLAFIIGTIFFNGWFIDYPKTELYGVSWENDNDKIIKLIHDALILCFDEKDIYIKPTQVSIVGEQYLRFFKSLGIKNNGDYMYIPDIILKSPKRVIGSFIRGAFLNTSKFDKNGFVFTNENIENLYQFSTLLYYFGVFSNIKEKCLHITGTDAIKFNNIIGFAEFSKSQKAKLFQENDDDIEVYDIVPHQLGNKIIDIIEQDINQSVERKKDLTEFEEFNNIKMSRLKKYNYGRKALIRFLNCYYKYNRPIISKYLSFLENNRFCKIENII